MKKSIFASTILAGAMAVSASGAFAGTEPTNGTFGGADNADPTGSTGVVGDGTAPSNDRDFWTFLSTGGTLTVDLSDASGSTGDGTNFGGFKPAVAVFATTTGGGGGFKPIGGYLTPSATGVTSLSFTVAGLTAGTQYWIMLTTFQNEGLHGSQVLSNPGFWGFDIPWDLSSQSGSASSYDYNLVLTGASQIAAVPVPAAAWLLGSGLIGLAGVARRKSA